MILVMIARCAYLLGGSSVTCTSVFLITPCQSEGEYEAVSALFVVPSLSGPCSGIRIPCFATRSNAMCLPNISIMYSAPSEVLAATMTCGFQLEPPGAIRNNRNFSVSYFTSVSMSILHAAISRHRACCFQLSYGVRIHFPGGSVRS